MAVAQLQKNSPTTVTQQQTQQESPEMTIARAQNDGRLLAASLQQQSSQIQIVSEGQPTDNHQ
jgi:hypothetical protein